MEDRASIRCSAQVSHRRAEVTADLCREMTNDHPANVRISIKNITGGKQRFDFGITPPFSKYVLSAQSGDSKLIIVPPAYGNCPGGNCVPEQPRIGCWTATAIPDVLDTGRFKVFSPDEEISQTYVLLNHPDNDCCFPSGRYVATDTVKIGIGSSRTESTIESCIEIGE